VFTLTPIKAEDWSRVDELQFLAYRDDLVEPLEVLKEKSSVANHMCQAVRKTSDNSMRGYILAHPYPANRIPPLKLLGLDPGETNSTNLFLHDFALDPSEKGKGAGRQVMQLFINKVKKAGFASITLVAVQSSVGYWAKMGFDVHDIEHATEDYGRDAVVMMMKLEKH